MTRLRKLGPAAVLGLVIGLGLAPPAFAQSAADKKAAAAEAGKAQKAFTAKKYAAAADLYESAFRKVANYHWYVEAARARSKSGDTVKAANMFAKAMKDGDGASKDQAKKELAAIAPKLGQLEIKADGASSITVDNDTVDTSLPLYFCAAGSRQVAAKFGDKQATLAPNVPAGVVTKVTLTAPADAAPPPALATTPAETKPAEDKPAEKPAESSGKPFSPLVVYIGAGVTVVGIGLTVWSGLDTQKQKDTFDSDKSEENLDAGKSKQMRTNVFLGVTIAAAVFTGVAAIFFTDWNKKSTDANIKVGQGGLRQKDFTIRFEPGPTSAALTGTF